MSRLEALADRVELEALVTEYAQAIDDRAWDRLDQVFTPDAQIDYTAMGGIKGSYPEIKKWLGEALAFFPGFMHLCGNFRFQVTGDTATGSIACFNPMIVPRQDQSGADTMFLGLWYEDRYVRTAQGWRIAARSERKSYSFNVPEWMQKAMNL
ncbi:MAG TPA: nuclear transport factor 2 family protein [Nevskiaceae bacterium]|nr:nuclear transport factor 2 family protein [Nevskiaceae bacterium]